MKCVHCGCIHSWVGKLLTTTERSISGPPEKSCNQISLFYCSVGVLISHVASLQHFHWVITFCKLAFHFLHMLYFLEKTNKPSLPQRGKTPKSKHICTIAKGTKTDDISFQRLVKTYTVKWTRNGSIRKHRKWYLHTGAP